MVQCDGRVRVIQMERSVHGGFIRTQQDTTAIGKHKGLVGARGDGVGLANFNDVTKVAYQLHQTGMVACDVLNVVE